MPQSLISFLLVRMFGSISDCFDFGTVELFMLSYFNVYLWYHSNATEILFKHSLVKSCKE